MGQMISREMNRLITILLLGFFACTCKKQNNGTKQVNSNNDTLVNLAHLNYLYTPVSFSDGTQAGGIYIYSEAPNYTLTPASGEGYTCVDDVSRAILVYIRNKNFSTDTSLQNRVYNLVRFVIEMQSANGYFYNFLQLSGQINMNGPTSINNAQWWSWRALQALTEALPILTTKNPSLAS